MRVFAMKQLIAIIVLSLLAVSATVYAVKKGGQVVELNSQITKIKKDNKAEIDKLNAKHNAEMAQLQAERERDNEIQGNLSLVLSQLNQLGFNVNAKLNEIKNRPVYNLRCSDNDGLQQINKYAGKTPAQISNN